MRKRIVAGNWKMNKTLKQSMKFLDEILPFLKDVDANTEVVFCPPFINLTYVIDRLQNTKILVGAQNMYYNEQGAFTGEISADMLTDIGVKYVIIGHSERRMIFGETDSDVNQKLHKALKSSLKPIVCVGETLEQRQQEKTTEIVSAQVQKAFESIDACHMNDIIIAYEPIWAIGTGINATSDQAQKECHAIRALIADMYNAEAAEDIHILYGGSVKANNAKELFKMSDIDGGLVGGASLDVNFADIVKA